MKNLKWFSALGALTLLFFYPLLSPGKTIYPASDVIGIFAPEKQLFAQTVFNLKTIPLWNPYIFSGSPFIGNPTSAMFYPLSALYLVLPVEYAFNIIFLIDVFLLGIFSFLYAQIITKESRVSFFIAVTIMLSGAFVSNLNSGHILNLDTFMWFPLTLFLIENYLLKKRLKFLIYTGLSTSMSFLAGASQITTYSLMMICIYIIFRDILFEKKFSLRSLVIFLIPTIIAVGISSVQLLPSLEFSSLSVRNSGLDFLFSSDFHLPPKQIISFILPYFFGTPLTYWGINGSFVENCAYIGIVPLLLLIFLKLQKNKYTILFLLLCMFSLLFAMGPYTPVFTFFYNFIPKFNTFRAPARFLYFYVFFISLLAGIGFKNLLFLRKKIVFSNKKYLFVMSILIVFLSVCLFLYYKQDISLYEKFILRNRYAIGVDHVSLFNTFVFDLFIFTLITLSFIFSLKKYLDNHISKKLFIGICLFIVSINLWIFDKSFILTESKNQTYSNKNYVQSILSDKSLYRVLDTTGLSHQLLLKENVQSALGAHSLHLKSYRDYLWQIGTHKENPYESFFLFDSITKYQNLNELNVKYVILYHLLPNNQFEEIAHYDNVPTLPNRIYIYKNKNMYPRIYFEDSKKDNDINGIIKIVSYTPNTITFTANLAEERKIVLSEINYPGWNAYDNNKKIDINTYKIFRKILLNKGVHSLEFRYEPKTFTDGLYVSIFSIFFTILLLIVAGQKKFL